MESKVHTFPHDWYSKKTVAEASSYCFNPMNARRRESSSSNENLKIDTSNIEKN